MKPEDIKEKLKTNYEISWCPGCPNHMILESVKKAISNLVAKDNYKLKDFVMTTDIGCNSKIFDYLNINGYNGLHGRAIPLALGIKLGNPNLKVISFMGDGGVYSEGIDHLVHAARYNANMTLIVHDNQSFSLTTGQCTPTSQQGFISKVEPYGEQNMPLNPIKLALACGMTFIARANAKDIEHTNQILQMAIKHPGTSFVEIVQDCLMFNKEMNNKDNLMYKVEPNSDKDTAELLADQWNYNGKTGKIPLGVLYHQEIPTLEEKWPQLKKLLKKKKGWKHNSFFG